MVRNSVNSSSFDCKSNALSHHKPTETQPTTPNATQQALKAIEGLKLTVELCGSWLWIFKAEAVHATALQAANFKWSYRKGAWYFCPDKNTRPLSSNKRPPIPIEKVREKYGSQVIQL